MSCVSFNEILADPFLVVYYDGFWSFESDGGVSDAVGSSVVGDLRCGALRVAEVGESVAGGDSRLPVDE